MKAAVKIHRQLIMLLQNKNERFSPVTKVAGEIFTLYDSQSTGVFCYLLAHSVGCVCNLA